MIWLAFLLAHTQTLSRHLEVQLGNDGTLDALIVFELPRQKAAARGLTDTRAWVEMGLRDVVVAVDGAEADCTLEVAAAPRTLAALLACHALSPHPNQLWTIATGRALPTTLRLLSPGWVESARDGGAAGAMLAP